MRRSSWPARLALAVALVVLGPALLLALRVVAWRPPAAVGAAADGRPRVRLASHVHTTASDGWGSLEGVTRAARQAGVTAIAVTDHDSFAHRDREGWVDGVLVLVGTEISSDDGHLVVLGLDPPPDPPSFETEEAAADVRRLGGLAVAAHVGHPRIGWHAGHDNVDGVEVANLDAAWRERWWPWRLLGSALARPLAGATAVAASSWREPAAVAALDRNSARRPFLAMGASDAHGWLVGYRATLGALVNVVLLDRPLSGDGARDRAAVVEALRLRRVLVAYPAIADPAGASFLGRGDGRLFLPGDEVPAGAGPVELEIGTGLGVDAALWLLHDGVTVAVGRGQELRRRVTAPGAYRAEVWLGGPFAVPWLVSNAIRIAGPPGATAAPAPPPAGTATAPPIAVKWLLRPEHDPRSAIAVRRDHRGQLAARYRLGVPASDEEEVWAALVDRTPRDLGRHRWLVVTGRADRELRVDVGFAVRTWWGEETFRRSLRLVPESTTHRFELQSFHGLTSSGSRPDDLSAVTKVQVVAHRHNQRPGSEAELRFTAFRFE